MLVSQMRYIIVIERDLPIPTDFDVSILSSVEADDLALKDDMTSEYVNE
jgi:hypothetical protein